MAASFLVVKLRAASLPENVTWMHMLGAAVLGGVGFTMAIFVANLAYVDAATIAAAKLGILLASLVAGVAGFSLLAVQAKSAQKQGVAFMSLGPSEMQRQTLTETGNVASGGSSRNRRSRGHSRGGSRLLRGARALRKWRSPREKRWRRRKSLPGALWV